MTTIDEAAFNRQVGARLTMAMAETDMDRAELALLTGYSEAEIEAWQEGRAVVYPSELLKLCDVLDKMPNWMLGWGLQ